MLRASRKQELKERIFTQAVKLFKEKGFDNVTVEEITQACGIAKGTFYNYFPKKEAVLLHLAESQLKSVHESIQRNENMPDLKQQLLLLFSDLFRRYAEQPDMIRLVVSEMMRADMFIHAEIRILERFRQALAALLEDAKNKGQLTTQAASEDIAAVLTGVYFNSLMIWLSAGSNTIRIEMLFQRHFDIVWEDIRSRGVVKQ
ncbi:TetR/AcrR family transcriptional regulator [Paenibacillus sp. MZ04-78.2]|uniref:TetR/AcrR family transcriptional regulator n=1 Tax=Paenibacillus sp. MZ04-78.2 TaxID=2962034 RepID=UPI0020B8BC68|nr:TetR/AcrR family transcriptional regulator [Paenibacillus sp. MZ04-78.2]MCP3776655.1 TetR/AcrR family transcriptional regulator [Paenibacillus sp. MZ04-78.2]